VTNGPKADGTPPPHPNKMVKRAQALMPIGITDVGNEGPHSQYECQEMRTNLALTGERTRLLASPVHRGTQEAILKRLTELASEAGPEELFVLMWHIAICPSRVLRSSTGHCQRIIRPNQNLELLSACKKPSKASKAA